MLRKTFVLLLTTLFVLSTATAFAGGDKNKNRHKGDKGQGSVIQNQIRK
ncbi:hypothetical protein KDK77_08090 [bacterium]|nr:hypothetical protein [bacterium]